MYTEVLVCFAFLFFCLFFFFLCVCWSIIDQIIKKKKKKKNDVYLLQCHTLTDIHSMNGERLPEELFQCTDLFRL